MVAVLTASLFMSLALPQRDGSQLVITREKPPLIIISPTATAPERLAARELADWLGQITGATLQVQASSTATSNSILVGPSAAARATFAEVPFSKLGDEELVLVSKGGRLLVAGGRPRGTVYAVNRLLHLQGVRWWAPWATTVPKKRELIIKGLNVRSKPAFESRAPFWYHAFDRDWARRNNSNSHHARLTEEDGGNIKYVGFVHTFYEFVPPSKHFKEHPEWYSLINGKRTADGAQLCTTNPALREFVVEKVREVIRKDPAVRIVSVSQNDWYNPCQCPDCKALDDAEGTNAASVLALANYVGEKIEKEFPNVAIDTLAYQYTRKAPKSLRPRKNVIVRLCSIECNFAQPLEHPSNKDFARDIRDWSRLTSRLYVWNYVTDFPNYLLPFPNWYTLGPNQRFFASNGVKGLFEQGAYQSTGGAMAEMEAWVQAQLLWNPRQADKRLIREFLEGYYGPASKPIQKYLDLMASAAKDTNMLIWTGPDADFFTLNTMLEAERLWVEAEKSAVGDPELLRRVKLGHLPVRYVILSRWVPFRREALARSRMWPLPDSRKAVAQEWLAVATAPGPPGWTKITHLSESGLTPERWLERFAVDPVVSTLPKRTATSVPWNLQLSPDADVIDLQDDMAKLYGEGSLAELRADPTASDGVACRMPSSHHEWAFQMPFSKAPARALSGRWTVYVVVRVEMPPGESIGPGQMFSAGIWDAAKNRSLASMAPSGKAVSTEYMAFQLSELALTKDAYVWVAPPAFTANAAVWVDRVLLVKTQS